MEASNAKKEIARRRVLAGGAATAALTTVAPFKAQAETPSASAENGIDLFQALKPFKFMNDKGEPVNLDALQAKLKTKNQPLTLSLGWTGCKVFCETADGVIADIGEKAGNKVTSIFINVLPETEGFLDPKMYPNHLRSQGVRQEAIVLYPLDARKLGGGDIRNALSNAVVPKVENALGSTIANQKDSTQHIATVFLFDSKGRYLDDQESNGPDFRRDWASRIAKANQPSR